MFEMSPRFRRRKLIDQLMQTILFTCIAITLLALGIILLTVFQESYQAWSFSLFLENTPAASGMPGGLFNAIMGTIIIVTGASFIGIPLGIGAGIAVAEYGQHSRIAQFVRFTNDILLSTPSIIVGLFVYTLCVYPFKSFSAWAGMVALSIILIPMVVRSTDSMLQLVPNGLREAAAALGAPMWKIIIYITLRSARSGIITGVLLGIARIAGETAPLLFTALNSLYLSWNLNAPMANLPVSIQRFASEPADDMRALAWAASGLITFSILLLTIFIRTFIKSPNP